MNGFTDSLSTYNGLLERLNQPIIMDAYATDVKESCKETYKEQVPQKFVNTMDGCICDGIFYSDCRNIVSLTNVDCLKENIFNTDYYDNGIFIKNSDPKCPKSSVSCCGKCYNKLNAFNFDEEFRKFYNISQEIKEIDYFPVYFTKNRKLCVNYSDKQTSLTYLNSVNQECNPENVCNVFFCKFENKAENHCPPMYFEWGVEFDKPIMLSSDFKTFKDYDNSGNQRITLPIIDMVLGRNKPCVDKKSQFNWNYPVTINDDCLHSDRFYEIFSESLTNIVERNNLKDFFNKFLPYYDKFTVANVWGIHIENAMNRFLIYCLSRNNLLFTNDSTTKEELLILKEKIAYFLIPFFKIDSNTSVINLNQTIMFISAVVLIIYESVFIFLKITIIILNHSTSKEIADKNEGKQNINEVNTEKSKSKSSSNNENKQENNNINNIDHKNNQKNYEDNTNDISNDITNHDKEFNKSKNIIEDIKYKDKDKGFDKNVKDTNKKNHSNNLSNFFNLKKDDEKKLDSNTNSNIIDNKEKMNENISKMEGEKNIKNEKSENSEIKETKSNENSNKKSGFKVIIIKILNVFESFSGYVSFIVDWILFIVCLICYTILVKAYNEIDLLIYNDCLDFDSYGKLKSFYLILVDVSYQSYEVMFLLFARLAIMVISFLYKFITEGKLKWKEIIKICCEIEDENDEDEESNEKKKVNTAVLAGIFNFINKRKESKIQN